MTQRELAAAALALLLIFPRVASAELPAATLFTPAEIEKILRHSPLPAVPDDPSNAVANDPRAARLGRRLFYDARGSATGQASCATCHDPHRSWSNGANVGSLDARHPRNVPSLWNVAYNRWFYWDGRADSLWSQALGPMENPLEMGGSRVGYALLVRDDRRLKHSYEKIFGPLPDLGDTTRFPRHAKPTPLTPAVPAHLAWLAMREADRDSINRVFSSLGKAIAAFERRIIAGDSPFDAFARELRAGVSQPRALDEAALRGLQLFIGKANCSLCHSGPNFTDREFHRLGRTSGFMRRDPGRHDGFRLVAADPFNRLGNFSDSAAGALVRFVPPAGPRDDFTTLEAIGQFKTPTLRNVALTAPYMHDGKTATLREVVVFYSTLAGSVADHREKMLKPLQLSGTQIDDLVTFLATLTAVQPAVPGATGPPRRHGKGRTAAN